VWVLKGFIDELPKEIEESAMIDGCSTLDILVRITLPLAKPAVASVAALCNLFSWNEFLFASMISGSETQTLMVMMSQFWVSYGIDYGAVAATMILSMIPPVIVALFLQRYFVRGLTYGAVKG